MIVGPDVEVAGRRIHPHAFEHADDDVVLRPAAHKVVGFLDGGLKQVKRRISAIRLEARIFVPALLIALNEPVVGRPEPFGRMLEEIVCVHAGQYALGVILADGVRRPTEGQRGGDLHLIEQAVAQGLFVERHIVAAPEAADQDVRVVGKQLGDVRGEVGAEQLRPRLGDQRGAGNQPLIRQHEMLMHVAAVAVIRLDGTDPLCLRPSLRRADRRGNAVG